MGKPIAWSEELMHKLVRTIDKNVLFKLLKEKTGEENLEEVELNKEYSLVKDMLGVKIEFGKMRIQRITSEDMIDILKKFVKVISKGNHYEFEAINDSNNVIEIARKLGLERPSLEAIQGYILNKELVQVHDGKYYLSIDLKYKDNPNNIFYVYRLYFTEIKDEKFLIVEKRI